MPPRALKAQLGWSVAENAPFASGGNYSLEGTTGHREWRYRQRRSNAVEWARRQNDECPPHMTAPFGTYGNFGAGWRDTKGDHLAVSTLRFNQRRSPNRNQSGETAAACLSFTWAEDE